MTAALPGLEQGRVDLAGLVARIRVAFPDLAFERAELNDLGEDHAVVVLDGAWVFSFPRGEAALAYAAGERALLRALSIVSPVATPRYERVSPEGDFGGYRMIAGTELSEAMFASLAPRAQDRVMDELGAFLAVLHGLPRDLARDEADPDPGAEYAARWGERRDAFAGVLTDALARRADRLFAALPAVVSGAPAVVSHRDLTEDHILLAPDGQGLAGIIDFTDAALGDPAFDFTFLWAYGEAAARRAAGAYGGDTAAMLARSRWWFARYRIDQLWWTLNGDRPYDTAKIVAELPALFEALEAAQA